MGTSLTEKAMLVEVHLSAWNAKKKDKRATDEIHAAHGASSNAGVYQKSLIARERLDDITKVSGEIRTFLYKFTLPWNDAGQRLLPSAAYFSFQAGINKLFSERERLVKDFVNNYSEYVQEAQGRLNGLYDAAEYPLPQEVEGKFGASVEFQPVPTSGDFRVNLSDDEQTAIKADIEARCMGRLESATADARNRLREAVEKLHERLSDDKKIFRNSLTENIDELCALIPLLNVADDPALNTALDAVRSKLAGLDAEDLRKDPTHRQDIAKEAQAILDQMKGVFG